MNPFAYVRTELNREPNRQSDGHVVYHNPITCNESILPSCMASLPAREYTHLERDPMDKVHVTHTREHALEANHHMGSFSQQFESEQAFREMMTSLRAGSIMSKLAYT